MAIDEQIAQRQHKRYRISAPITLYRDSSHSGLGLPGISLEISAGGISAVFTDQLAVGDKVGLVVEVPVGRGLKQRLEISGVVRNRIQFRYGFEFYNLCDADRDIIKAACTGLPLYVGGDGY
jgi:c-di-GMP-binding flagellar brake protein YcgR